MPGTTYTRTGPENDSVGRLADFARFAVGELDEIRRAMNAPDNHDWGTPPRRADYHAAEALLSLGTVDNLLDGYTTADD
jgi:hypothetical protein